MKTLTFTLTLLFACLVQSMSARTPEKSSDHKTALELRISKAEYAQKGSLYQPTFQLEVKAPAPLPADEEILMLRLYRQSGQGKPEKQDIYLTASAVGINPTLHSAASSWTDKLALTQIPAGTSHRYTFSLVTNRHEYFSNTVEETAPAAKQQEPDGQLRQLPVVFHVFHHPGLPQLEFDKLMANEWIAAANAALGNETGAIGLTDTRVRLVAAQQTPDGKPLPEAGIHRSNNSPMLCMDGRAEGLELEYPDLFWSQNDYLNVVLLPFAMTGNYNFCNYPQFPQGKELAGCQTVERPTLPHVIYLNSLMEPIHGIPFFLTALGYYLGLIEDQNNGVNGLNPMKNTYVGCTPQQAERVDYTLRHAWNTVNNL